MTASVLPRRGFLRGLTTLPLIGGGVTLIGKTAAQPVSLLDVAAAPILSDPRERARYAWTAFSAAMREITTDADGFYIRAAERAPVEHAFAGGRQSYPAFRWLRAESVHLVPDEDPRYQGVLIERNRDIDLGGPS